jgi:hypothetical protein
MISVEDCIALSGLTREEIDAIAEHEHLPEAAAAALAAWLMAKEEAGTLEIRQMIRDDIRAALKAGNRAHAAELLAALRHFLSEHPVAKGGRQSPSATPSRRGSAPPSSRPSGRRRIR